MAILTETFPGAPGGSNVANPQHELDDTEARMIQDGLVDRPGETRRRGPVTPVSGVAQPSRPVSGITLTLDPLGNDRYGVLNGDNSNGYFSVWNDNLDALVDLAWPHALPTSPEDGVATAYRIVDAKPSLTGGTLIGVSSRYDANSPNQGIAFWRGGNKDNYTGTITVARGSAAVTGTGTTFLADVSPGMFMFGEADHGAGYTSVYFGIVLQVNSDTSLTLGAVSPYAATAKSATFQALRGLAPRVAKGRITTATDSTSVTGGGTKFKGQLLDTGTWDIYRRSDLTWVGKVSSVASDISLTLAANAAVAMSDEEYIAFRADADYSIINTANTNKVGFLNATYAERQWYFNLGSQYSKTTMGWFSDTNDPEALDLSEDGDNLEFASTVMVNEPIRGAQAAHNALLVFKENETFGIFGNSPSNFTVRKVEDDGALSGGSIQPWGGGVVWAGRDGIHFYDGIQVENITQKKIGDVWKNSVRTFDPSRYRMYSMVVRDHYYLWVENLAPTLAVVKGNTSTTPSSWGVMVNLVTRAPTWLTNVHLRGAITLPASTGREVWYVSNSDLDTPTGLAAVASASGGTLATATYYYKVTAVNSIGETVGSSEVSAAVTGPTGSVALSWTAVDGADTYRVYRGTASGGQNTYYATTATSYTDTGSAGTADTVPSTNESNKGVVSSASDLFDAEGVDDFGADGGVKGPDFFFESKKFAAGDSLRLKRYKQIALHYLAQGGDIMVDTVLGLNNVGTTLVSTFPASVYTWDTLRAAISTWDALAAEFATWSDVIDAVFDPARVKFMKKSQHLSFRLYQESAAMTRVKLGPYQLGYKLQRPGRV
jgi:hypothetical protein